MPGVHPEVHLREAIVHLIDEICANRSTTGTTGTSLYTWVEVYTLVRSGEISLPVSMEDLPFNIYSIDKHFASIRPQ